MKVKNIVLAVSLAVSAGTGSAAFVEANVESRQPVEVKTEAVKGKAASLLPPAMPAAAGICFSSSMRRPGQDRPTLSKNSFAALTARFFSSVGIFGRAQAQLIVPLSFSVRHSVSARVTLCMTMASSW